MRMFLAGLRAVFVLAACSDPKQPKTEKTPGDGKAAGSGTESGKAGSGKESAKGEGTSAATSAAKESGDNKDDKKEEFKYVKKTEAEWKKELTADEFYVLRKKGTERAFTGKYWNSRRNRLVWMR